MRPTACTTAFLSFRSAEMEGLLMWARSGRAGTIRAVLRLTQPAGFYIARTSAAMPLRHSGSITKAVPWSSLADTLPSARLPCLRSFRRDPCKHFSGLTEGEHSLPHRTQDHLG